MPVKCYHAKEGSHSPLLRNHNIHEVSLLKTGHNPPFILINRNTTSTQYMTQKPNSMHEKMTFFLHQFQIAGSQARENNFQSFYGPPPLKMQIPVGHQDNTGDWKSPQMLSSEQLELYITL